MLEDLFFNATIIITFITIGTQFFFKEHENITSFSLSSKIIYGIMNGVLGSLLMLYSVTVVQNVIVDFRSIAIIIAALFGGFISSIIASLVIGIFRIAYFGIMTSSIIAFIGILIMGIGCPIIISKILLLKKRWIYMTLFCNSIMSIIFVILIDNGSLLMNVLSIYWIGSFIIAIILYKYTKYIITSNELFRRYKEESTRDFLTGLNNVRQFDKAFNTITNKVLERKEHLSLLFIDIDFFKKVNDTYGHVEGDVVLQDLGEILLKTCRDFDIVSRNGGEEFSVMLMDCLPQQAVDIAERIRVAVENYPFTLSSGKVIHITVSVGIAVYPDTTNDIYRLKEEADNALYKAKHTGRNKVVLQETK